MTAPALWFVVPAGIDDPTRPSGGNRYDQRVRDGLTGLGWDVHQLVVPELLATVPDGGLALVDGLVGSEASDALLAEAERLRLVVLSHMAFETPAERRLLRAAAAVMATSQWTRQWLLENYALPVDKVAVAQPGVDLADPVPGTEGGGELLCVAAVTPGKGQDVLVSALAHLDDLDWRMTVVGPLDRDPAYVDAVLGRVADAGLGERVRFAGTCSREEVAKAYAEADLVVLPTRGESYGMVVTEALAHGLPVVASAVGGVPEALGRAHGGSLPGLFVPPGDVDALAAALRLWLTEPLRRRRLRRAAGLRRLTLAGWSRTTAELHVVLDRLRAVPR